MASLDYEWNGKQIHLELKTDVEYSIGRDSSCRICLNAGRLSRRHCVVFFNTGGNGFALADLNSTNGTFLNGEAVGRQEIMLRDGDRFRAGAAEFEFRDPASSTATRKVPTISTKLKMLSGMPFAPGADPENGSSKLFKPGDRPVSGTVKSILSENERTATYITGSGDGQLHVLKVYKDPPADFSAGRELTRLLTEQPRIPGLPAASGGALDSGLCWYSTEYLEAPSFARMISMLAPLVPCRSLALIYSAAMILDRGCCHGVIHGDLKPSKIIYAPRNGNYIVGAGLTPWRDRFYPDYVHRPGQWYAAPEATAGKPVWQSDLYSLGIMFFQLLTGVLPFRADSVPELEEMHRSRTMPLPQERNPQVQVHPSVTAILIRMTMKQPEQRYASWKELMADLARANSLLRKEKEKSNHNR